MSSTYRRRLPQLDGGVFLTDGGTETYLIYKQGLDFPHFAAFHRLADAEGYGVIKDYYRRHAEVAVRLGFGFIFCSITYRASRDWGELLGYSPEGLAEMNHKAVDLFRDVAAEFEQKEAPMLISGCIGPRGDAYKLDKTMSAEEAEAYHAEQVATFDVAGVDMLTALTLTSIDEAVGVARAASARSVPSVISFTLGRGGRLKTGESLREAIEAVDERTNAAPAYYMINCAHPDDFEPALEDADWMRRVRGLRANASNLDHGVLCQLGRLEEGDPSELGKRHGAIARRFPHINVWGGCCGTDDAHIEHIGRAVAMA